MKWSSVVEKEASVFISSIDIEAPTAEDFDKATIKKQRNV